ncbi:hypothetical protein [Pseudoduganella sp. OTU4001]|uniref:hypothetical protein n=1 Tax=Pseudoduganella sp. OTU4001 TaxID=3043854 RepID=UPI00313D6F67
MTTQAAAIPRSTVSNSLLHWAVLLGLIFSATRAAAMLGPVAWRPLFLIHHGLLMTALALTFLWKSGPERRQRMARRGGACRL